ncbi:hypothetical protein PFICI_13652 [Pestalotiopsis fici W106-1]|uniref:RNA helicase n=1 Tax=Pestalotiopsis fici (strain W106-1 / CGMCC3.15140) TaxID=1229662 RepID=W3WMT3_PESFW|nr:uncharacterized protein PFICI_13652 [Pestalotiopsis fici W106-1]ETS75168.1 hypothetical protein PFICI_13652 [Pestalotiopsis fici W106-1]
MDQLRRNQTTAEQATALEDGNNNFLTNKPYSARFRELLKQRRRLPVSANRSRFLELYQRSRVIILTSDTGSGKTTQSTQFILFDEFASGKMVACTQPRRLAATSVATRVAEELDVELGAQVGYNVRFDVKGSKETRLGYMTDGKLLAGAMADPLFSKYCCIIIDEAHERTIPTDILLALLKRAISDRDDLSVVIMSATLDAQRFQKSFWR